MTRRHLLAVLFLGRVLPARQTDVIVPVHLLIDRGRFTPRQISRFQSGIWSEAVRDLERCGVRLEITISTGEVSRPPGRTPVITGLRSEALNFVVTNHIPVKWDGGRALAGVATMYRGRHLCMIALHQAHGHQIPFLSVNTCLHELLHALMHDIFEERPEGLHGGLREFRIDFYATRLWLFRDGGAIRNLAERYVQQLRTGADVATVP